MKKEKKNKKKNAVMKVYCNDCEYKKTIYSDCYNPDFFTYLDKPDHITISYGRRSALNAKNNCKGFKLKKPEQSSLRTLQESNISNISGVVADYKQRTEKCSFLGYFFNHFRKEE